MKNKMIKEEICAALMDVYEEKYCDECQEELSLSEKKQGETTCYRCQKGNNN